MHLLLRLHAALTAFQKKARDFHLVLCWLLIDMFWTTEVWLIGRVVFKLRGRIGQWIHLINRGTWHMVALIVLAHHCLT